MTLKEELQQRLSQLQNGSEKYAVHVVEELLALAQRRRASDLHLIPDETLTGLLVLFRIDGVLDEAGTIQGGINVVSRLKVIAGLLTYRTDVPQEGRLKAKASEVEIRISTFPTLHGEKAVIRFFVGSGEYLHLADLGYSPEIQQQLERLLHFTNGLILACGPAGSGKTTTLYACLREIQQHSSHQYSICTLEDPVEAIVPGISQSLIKPSTEFNYQRGLISLMRQDPDVIMVGEIRDRETAEIVFQASLTGHLVLSTFHAGTAAEALGRLADMEIEPYVLRSGLTAVLAQRLLRKSCACRRVFAPAEGNTISAPTGIAITGDHTGAAATQAESPTSCKICRGSGYQGRIVVAELLHIDHPELIKGILDRNDVQTLGKQARQSGMIPLMENARRMEAAELTTIEECCRVFGPDFLK